MIHSKKNSLIFGSFVIFFVVLCDQISKHFIKTYFLFGEEKPIFSWLSFLYAYNKGVAFSFLSSFNTITLISFTIFIILILIILWIKTSFERKMTFFGLAFILGGAIGNLIDRIYLHHVIDFIYFHIGKSFSFAIFNIADSFITIGVIFILIDEFIPSKSKIIP